MSRKYVFPTSDIVQGWNEYPEGIPPAKSFEFVDDNAGGIPAPDGATTQLNPDGADAIDKYGFDVTSETGDINYIKVGIAYRQNLYDNGVDHMVFGLTSAEADETNTYNAHLDQTNAYNPREDLYRTLNGAAINWTNINDWDFYVQGTIPIKGSMLLTAMWLLIDYGAWNKQINGQTIAGIHGIAKAGIHAVSET